ncbi:MAG: hypothetical protein RMZ69_31310 [Nostoc sp. ChiQUE01a]|nr:hypothetical protein [Nostoc sp. ChiQUE01a]
MDFVYCHTKQRGERLRTGNPLLEVLPLNNLCYQHSASLFGFRWKVEDGGIEPLGVTPPRFSRPVADHLAASSI